MNEPLGVSELWSMLQLHVWPLIDSTILSAKWWSAMAPPLTLAFAAYKIQVEAGRWRQERKNALDDRRKERQATAASEVFVRVKRYLKETRTATSPIAGSAAAATKTPAATAVTMRKFVEERWKAVDKAEDELWNVSAQAEMYLDKSVSEFIGSLIQGMESIRDLQNSWIAEWIVDHVQGEGGQGYTVDKSQCFGADVHEKIEGLNKQASGMLCPVIRGYWFGEDEAET